jgi:hypothetical protein
MDKESSFEFNFGHHHHSWLLLDAFFSSSSGQNDGQQ